MDRRTDYILSHQGKSYPCELVPQRRNRHIRLKLVTASAEYIAGRWPGATFAPREQSGQLSLLSLNSHPMHFVRVSFPPRISKKAVVQTIHEYAAWIETQFEHAGEQKVSYGPTILRSGSKLAIQGKMVPFYILPTARKSDPIEYTGTAVLCHGAGWSGRQLLARVEKWYRQTACRVITERIGPIAKKMTTKAYTVRIANQKTQWGSCSQDGQLCFNWRLVLFPKYVMEYIIVHECAHLVELNHSRKFWELVEKHCKTTECAKLWLKKNGVRFDHYLNH